MNRLLASSLAPAALEQGRWVDKGPGPGSAAGQYVNWLTIENNPESVTADVERIRAHPLVPGNIPIYGYIYDVSNGQLIEVADAMKAGRPRK